MINLSRQQVFWMGLGVGAGSMLLLGLLLLLWFQPPLSVRATTIADFETRVTSLENRANTLEATEKEQETEITTKLIEITQQITDVVASGQVKFHTFDRVYPENAKNELGTPEVITNASEILAVWFTITDNLLASQEYRFIQDNHLLNEPIANIEGNTVTPIVIVKPGTDPFRVKYIVAYR